jgi:ABC-type antimicrobial peptide transport system permease subunit
MLTLPRLVLRNLWYHRRGNLAVLLGVAVGSAVLTGALLVGDSLRGSLRARAERQLAGVAAAAVFSRPVRADLADGLPGDPAPVLMLPGSVQAVTADPATAPHLGRVTVLGVDRRFTPAADGVSWDGDAKVVVLSGRVADKLGVAVGGKVRLAVERFSDVPRSSALARRGAPDVTAADEFTVAAVLPAGDPKADFQLAPNPAAPLNVFVPLHALSDLVRPRSPDGKLSRDDTVRANALLAADGAAAALNDALRPRLRPEDYGLKFRDVRRPEPKGANRYLSVESAGLVLPPATAAAVVAAAKDLGLPAEPTVVYIADALSHDGKEIPYPVVAGLNPAAPLPLGPFLPPGLSALADGEVVLLDWPGSELAGLPDLTPLRLTYFDPEVEGEGRLKAAELTLRGYLPLAGPARDPNLPPEVPGVTEAGTNFYTLDLPPVLPKARVRERVPDKAPNGKPHPRGAFFNSLNKATPMAYVNLATGEKLFGSRFGAVTSVRVAPGPGETPEQTGERLRAALPKHLDPAAAGMAFDPVRDRLLTASRGGTDFGGLFLGFSFFLIAAALMLVGLLFRLTLDRRAKEVGLLLAAGFSVRKVRRVLVAEGLLVAVVGALLGLALAVGYNRLLLAVLLTLWPDKGVANVLRSHAEPVSFAIGFGLTVLMSLAALWLSVRGLVRLSPPALLRGETEPPATGTRAAGRVSWLLVIASVPVGIALVVAGRFVANPDFRAMTFFAGGGLLLTAGLAALWRRMRRARTGVVTGRGPAALAALGGRNAARNPARSLLTAALLAAAAFLLVAVESFRRQPGGDFGAKTGGSGGFDLIAEIDFPVANPVDSRPGREDLDARVRAALGGSADDPRYRAAVEALAGAEVFSLRLRDGDDASCMNLFQAARPRVLDVPDALIDRGGFGFYATEAATPEEKANPWLLLRKGEPGGPIPVFCEQNTAQWMLKKAVGDTLTMPADDGSELTLRLVGTFADSPFQGELVMSEGSFARAFPNSGGYRVFLVRSPPGQEAAVNRALSLGLRENGVVVTPTREKVAAYQAVIGAYLTTFQVLGGLGLLLGVLGLAVVVLRGVWERVGELALLRAVGYRPRQLQFLVLAENALLLAAGLGIGVAAALVSVAPHVAAGADVPWGRLAATLGLVLAVGLGVASAATAGILRVPLIPALRRE